MWWKASDDMFQHPKWKRIKTEAPEHFDNAVALYVQAAVWCMKYLTDGVVPKTQVREFTRRKGGLWWVVQVGLWHELDPKHYTFHDWLDYQPSKTSVQRNRTQTKQRVRSFRNADGNGSGNADSNADSNALGNGVCNAVSNAAPDPGSRSESPKFKNLNAALDPRKIRARERQSGGEVEKSSGDGESGLVAKVRAVLAERFDGVHVLEPVLLKLTAWLEANHPSATVAVCERLADTFYRDPWAKGQGYPLADLAKRPGRYLTAEGLISAKQAEAGALLRSGDVAAWRVLMAEIQTLQATTRRTGGSNGAG